MPTTPPLLPRLLAPVAPTEFVDTHWEKRSLYIPGSPGKLAPLAFDRRTFERLLDELEDPVRLETESVGGDGGGIELRIKPPYASALRAAGLPLRFPEIQKDHPPLLGFLARLKRELRFLGTLTVDARALSPEANLSLRFSECASFVLQIDGEAHWRYGASPAVLAPPVPVRATAPDIAAFRERFPWADIERPDEGELSKQRLRPGDVLYLPTGTWHGVTAESATIALVVRCTPRNFHDFTRKKLKEVVLRNVSWREAAPIVPSEMAAGDGFPDPVRSFFVERLAELVQIVERLEPADLAELWRTETTMDGPPEEDS